MVWKGVAWAATSGAPSPSPSAAMAPCSSCSAVRGVGGSAGRSAGVYSTGISSGPGRGRTPEAVVVVVVVGAAVVGVAARFSVGDMLLLLWRPLAPAAEEGACLLSVPLAPLSLGGGRVSSVATSGDDNHPECNTMRQRYSTWTTHTLSYTHLVSRCSLLSVCLAAPLREPARDHASPGTGQAVPTAGAPYAALVAQPCAVGHADAAPVAVASIAAPG